jgi:hypothetical protein
MEIRLSNMCRPSHPTTPKPLRMRWVPITDAAAGKSSALSGLKTSEDRQQAAS